MQITTFLDNGTKKADTFTLTHSRHWIPTDTRPEHSYQSIRNRASTLADAAQEIADQVPGAKVVFICPNYAKVALPHCNREWTIWAK